MLTLEEIRQARERIAALVRRTPLLEGGEVPAARGCRVLLKAENLQRTGAFKIRGASNCLALLSEAERSRGVIAASAGNHAQGVAAAAQALGTMAIIVMPEATPLIKVDRTRQYGAEVVLAGEDFDAAYQEALRLQGERGLVFVHPFADQRVIAGQGTVGLEILEQAPEVESVVVPVGGGGLIGGVAVGVKEQRPEVKVFGVQAGLASAMQRSFASGELTSAHPEPTIAEGIAVGHPAPITFDLVQRYVDDIIAVSETDIAAAMLELLEDHKLVVEGAGAVPYAALDFLAGRLGRCAVLVLSGGNADVTTLGAVIDHGLAVAGRSVRLKVDLRDVPGALAQLAGVLGSARANIIEIYHNRLTGNLEVGRAEVEIVLNTRGPEHVEEVLHLLRVKGYDPRRVE